MPAAGKEPISPVDLERLKTQCEFMLFHLGLSQKRAAYELGVHYTTVSRWSKKNNWRQKLKRRNAYRMENNVKFDDSLTAYLVFLKTKNPTLYTLNQAAYKQYLKTF